MIASLELILRNTIIGSKAIIVMDFIGDREERMMINSESFQLVIESSTLIILVCGKIEFGSNYQKIIVIIYYVYFVLHYWYIFNVPNKLKIGCIFMVLKNKPIIQK